MKKDLFGFIPPQAIFFLIFCLTFISAVSHALPLNIVPKEGVTFPTTVNVGSSVMAYYTISNNTLSQRNNNFIKHLPPYVSQVTQGTYNDTCGTTFNLAAKGQIGSSCTLQLSVTGAVNGNDPNANNHLFACFPGGVTCAGTQTPLNVTQVNESALTSIVITPLSPTILAGHSQQFIATGIYSNNSTADITSSVTWHSSNTAIATIGATTGLATATTEGTTFITATLNGINSNSQLLTVGPLFAYITNSSDASFCQINNTDNSFVTCGTANIIDTLSVAINPSGTLVYFGSSAQAPIKSCSLESDGSIGACTTASPNNDFVFPSGLAFNSNGNRAYITQLITSQGVSVCSVDLSTGILAPCTVSGAIANGLGIVINSTNTIAYVTDLSGNVNICNLDNDGAFVNCQIDPNIQNDIPNAFGLAISGSNLYVTDQGSDVYMCPITGGTLGSCVSADGSGFNTTKGIAINPAGTVAYIVNHGNNTVTYCNINTVSGLFTSCTNQASPVVALSSPVGIAIPK